MLKSMSNSLILRGALALVVGVLALAWPGVTVFALVVLFALYAFVAGILQAVRAFGSAKVGPVVGHLLLALVNLAAGVVAIAWPVPTAFVLVVIVGCWAVVAGVVEVFSGFRTGELAGTRAMFILGGLVSIALGIVLLGRPGMGAVALALVFGLFNLISGAYLLVQGIDLRHTRNTLHSLTEHRKAA